MEEIPIMGTFLIQKVIDFHNTLLTFKITQMLKFLLVFQKLKLAKNYKSISGVRRVNFRFATFTKRKRIN